MMLKSPRCRSASGGTTLPLHQTVGASDGCLLPRDPPRVPAVCRVCLEADIRAHRSAEASHLEHNEKPALTYLANISLPSQAAPPLTPHHPHTPHQWPAGIKREISRESRHCTESLSDKFPAALEKAGRGGRRHLQNGRPRGRRVQIRRNKAATGRKRNPSTGSPAAASLRSGFSHSSLFIVCNHGATLTQTAGGEASESAARHPSLTKNHKSDHENKTASRPPTRPLRTLPSLELPPAWTVLY